ncbi:hypothetical protein [Stieleria maiorica]|uniref:hypothetical protein n=1 Tax=Stieleria maiorica TaxID=2795974 RepID=UPI0011C7A035|nr:hypothetical protein [Stieleria maiorica]
MIRNLTRMADERRRTTINGAGGSGFGSNPVTDRTPMPQNEGKERSNQQANKRARGWSGYNLSAA